ncbi:MAG: GNAT family N-acetyltransferase, partial [Caldilineaceae bacterium]|nr:GNAT family N-acetyltransferase [Caldilineaceae bacterium]
MIEMRTAALADLRAIVALDQEIFGVYGADEDPRIIEGRLKAFPAGCVVLMEEGRLVAYLTTEKWKSRREPALNEDPAITHQPEGTVLNITTLAVAPSAQGRGLGGRLLDAAIEIACREACVEIVLETARAKEFYLARGFEWIGDRSQRGILLNVMVRLLQND